MRHNLENLKKHYEHIKNGKLIHKEFKFNKFNSIDGSKETDFCGTQGCSFGEIPAWNKDVLFNFENYYKIEYYFKYKNVGMNCIEIAKELFGINEEEFDHLFLPNNQSTSKYGGKALTSYATKEEVNENLRIFIEKIESGEIQ